MERGNYIYMEIYYIMCHLRILYMEDNIAEIMTPCIMDTSLKSFLEVLLASTRFKQSRSIYLFFFSGIAVFKYPRVYGFPLIYVIWEKTHIMTDSVNEEANEHHQIVKLLFEFQVLFPNRASSGRTSNFYP